MARAAALELAGDRSVSAPSLSRFLSEWAGADGGRCALAGLVSTIAEAAVPLALRLALARLPGDPAAPVAKNDSGDIQKALDLGAHTYILDALRKASVARVVSEEAGAPILLNEAGLLDVAIDPIDGSGSIGTGAPLGLLFAVFPKGESFLRSGRDTLAAGYVAFGHSVDLGFSMGDGVFLATLDPRDGQFRVAGRAPALPEKTRTIAFNASNYRHFPPGLRRYIDDCLAGRQGLRGADVNMRWIAAAVGDLHRILLRGGVFLYPADHRPGYEKGHLRLLYEAFPIAFLIEQAGGAATDGYGPILARTPADIHEKTALVFGSAAEVATVQSYLNA
ncbi:class 1 fructose-bisphosphatase [Chelativorans intermedius]|uniref:Fructose-1,6-bisphosphatase class 1 n=1 Tax=Chelativorans intermedius TaxID=515947 RepID=A0ABV6DCI7_9HYPH|nr:class 1 fructose-bisphosphatase [Chelativorans intermedius]MCT9000440.1 class 1 fructose-bisphosphatase [Chelativorans intermedius]